MTFSWALDEGLDPCMLFVDWYTSFQMELRFLFPQSASKPTNAFHSCAA